MYGLFSCYNYLEKNVLNREENNWTYYLALLIGSIGFTDEKIVDKKWPQHQIY